MTSYASPTAMFDALALEAVDEELYNARLSPTGRRHTDDLQEDARTFVDNRRVFSERLGTLEARDDISDQEKQRQRDQLLQGWLSRVDGQLSTLEARAQRAVSNAEAQTRLPALDTARQSAAENHVRMILETTPTGALTNRLAELASSTYYPDVSQMLLSTQFGRMFLEARGARGIAGDEWEERRLEALRPKLSAAGQTALDDLPGLRAATRIPQHLRGFFDNDRRKYRA